MVDIKMPDTNKSADLRSAKETADLRSAKETADLRSAKELTETELAQRLDEMTKKYEREVAVNKYLMSEWRTCLWRCR